MVCVLLVAMLIKSLVDRPEADVAQRGSSGLSANHDEKCAPLQLP